MTRFIWTTCVTIAWLPSITLHAGLVTYDVDLFGMATLGSGHFLQVSGTITADTTTDTLTECALTFFHAGDPGLELPTLPVSSGVGFVWDATETELRFERVDSVDTGAVTWEVGAPPMVKGLTLGSGASDHRMYYFEDDHFVPPALGPDILILLPSGNAEHPGFLVGVASDSPLQGDFNGDGRCDSADLLLWQRDPTVGSLSDWETSYGLPSSLLEPAEIHVPEPATWFSLLIGLAAINVCRRATRMEYERRI